MFNLTGVTVGSGDILMPLIWVSRALALEAWGTPGGVRRALVRGRCHVGSREPSTPSGPLLDFPSQLDVHYKKRPCQFRMSGLHCCVLTSRCLLGSFPWK